jgi:hypothetical protein
MNTEHDIENKIKKTSIRGRFAFGVFCIEKYISENDIHSKWIDKLIPTLWEFTNTDKMDLWEEKISDLTPLNILEYSPRNSYSDYPSLSESEFNELKKYYSELDNELIQMIDETIEIGLGNLYGGTGEFSKETFESTMFVYKLADKLLSEKPNFDNFYKSRFTEFHGWGNNVERKFFQ